MKCFTIAAMLIVASSLSVSAQNRLERETNDLNNSMLRQGRQLHQNQQQQFETDQLRAKQDLQNQFPPPATSQPALPKPVCAPGQLKC